ncbi:hypothetical protein JRQ81_012048 [Phrynocephalus forsythii]|uniref:Uncharacterized protein n=1 Tax=Phrynocephalus forsythii TaxID=171643 RepID=A0A9Q1AQP3_9SAUR|nr:hypothetical protein JRQ81_012048 [Phrynocephalus forsythii]
MPTDIRRSPIFKTKHYYANNMASTTISKENPPYFAPETPSSSELEVNSKDIFKALKKNTFKHDSKTLQKTHVHESNSEKKPTEESGKQTVKRKDFGAEISGDPGGKKSQKTKHVDTATTSGSEGSGEPPENKTKKSMWTLQLRLAGLSGVFF